MGDISIRDILNENILYNKYFKSKVFFTRVICRWPMATIILCSVLSVYEGYDMTPIRIRVRKNATIVAY